MKATIFTLASLLAGSTQAIKLSEIDEDPIIHLDGIIQIFLAPECSGEALYQTEHEPFKIVEMLEKDGPKPWDNISFKIPKDIILSLILAIDEGDENMEA